MMAAGIQESDRSIHLRFLPMFGLTCSFVGGAFSQPAWTFADLVFQSTQTRNSIWHGMDASSSTQGGAQSTHTCRSCAQTFTTQKQQAHHQRKRHQQESRITIGQRNFLLKRAALDGKFCCPIYGCKKRYPKAEGVRRHIRAKHMAMAENTSAELGGMLIHSPASEINNAPKSVIGAPKRRYPHHQVSLGKNADASRAKMYLESLGLALDEYEWILICGKCGYALSEHPAQHLKRHCLNVEDADISLAMDLIKEATPRKVPKLDMNGCRPAYPCIPVHRGYRCPCCTFCFSTRESLVRHEQCHAGDPATTEVPRKVWMQRLRKGGLGSSYVEVQQHKPSKRPHVDAQAFSPLLEAQRKKHFVVNLRRLHPVYQTLGLGVLLDRLALNQFRELGFSEINPTLITCMHGLLYKTHENTLHDTAAREVFGRLYTKSGNVLTTRFYQKVMQQSYDRYIIVATRYVQYLLRARRRDSQLPGRISDELAKALDDVEVAQGQNNTALSEALTHVWCAILDESTDMNNLDLEYCPTIYILCTTVQANNTFKQPSSWTPTLAALLWICRLFLLFRRQLDPNGPGALTDDTAVKTRLTEGRICYYLGSRLTYVRKCTSEEGKYGSWVGQDLKDAGGRDFYAMLLEHILETPELVKAFTMPNAPGKFSVWRWICSLQEFNRLALTYTHLSTAPPMHATVYTSLFYRDSSASPRNVFFSGNRLAFVAQQGEATLISNPESHAIHYMDERTSAIMMAYLLLCKPLEELFANYLQERGELIASSAIDSNSLTEEEQDELEAGAMEVEDSVAPNISSPADDQHADLRAVKRVELEGTYELLFNIVPMQLEKQLRPGLVYRTIQAVTKRFLGTSITVSAWRHMSVAWLRTLVMHDAPELLGALDVTHFQSQRAGRTARDVQGRTQRDHKVASSESEYGHQFLSDEWRKLIQLISGKAKTQTAERRPGQVYAAIQAVAKRFLGASITDSACHMSVAWPRTLVLHHTPEPSLGALNVAHSQSQHAGRTARNVYGRTQLDHKFVFSEAQYGHQFVSEEWHKLMKLVDVEDQIQAEAVDGQTCVQQVVHKQVVIQSSRVRNVSTQVQATVGTQTDPEVEACLDAEDDIDDIIAGLDLDEAEAAESSMPVAVPRAVKEAASTALQQEPSQHNDQTQQQEYEDQIWLAQCVRQAWKTTFRDWDQYRLAQAMTRHEAQDGWLLAVAPTGMGKTLCTLAHLQPRRVVVWVVPLRELARDLCRRFKQADIVSQWAKNDGRDMQVNVQVIVMTVDFLVGHGMSYRGSLVRCPSRLDHLRQDPSVKCVGLTGTLCPKDERALLQQLDCTEDALYQTFRMPTMRTDLRLAVQQGTTKAFEMFVERHYGLLEQEGRVDRMLIFCDTKKQVEALSTQLARTLGHEQSLSVDADMSAEDTRAALEQWRSGTQSLVLVATSCLGAGLDMPNVRKVIWFGSGYNGYTLSQAFGRAGRDRRGGEATLWIPRGTAVSEDLRPFASMKRCLTFELGWLLDGEGHICAAAGAPACTVCSMMQPTITARHPSREAHGAPVSHEGQTQAKRAQLM
ncbi:uncharacterized protein MONBRDRAFT_11770, partial [Monosiga brevicollis MX1]